MNLTPEEMRELVEAEVELLKRDFRFFIESAWHLVEPKKFIPGWHIDAIAEHLQAVYQRQIRNLLINIPPRCTKSLQCSVLYPAWVWVNRPEEAFLCASYAQDLSLRDAVKARRLIQHEWYQDRFADIYQLTGDQNAKHKYENNRGGVRLSTSVAGQSTGHGGDTILVDDPHNAKEVESDARRKEVQEWWDGAMSTRDNDMETSCRIVVMQRVHEKDLSGLIIKEGGWEHLKLPMEFNPKKRCFTSLGWKDPRTQPGESICPRRFSDANIAKLRRKLGVRAPGQLDQEPAPLEGNIVKRAHFNRYNARSKPKEFDYLLGSVDCSFDKDGNDPSYVVVQMWGLYGIRKYLLHQVREFMNLVETLEVTWNVYRQFHPNETLIEKKANGAGVISVFKEKIPGMTPTNPKESKYGRFVAISPEIMAGNYYLPDESDAPWVEDYINELCTFPNSSYDDQVDATSQAAKRLRKLCAAFEDMEPEALQKHSLWDLEPQSVDYDI